MNRQRRKKSGGQAIIMATLALLAMCGMMGLAVDLGWSFFVQKQAQAAADAAALGAVQEAATRLGGGSVTGYTCAGGGSGSGQVDCQTSKVGCGSVASTSNLNNGCQYALKNGFDWTNARQAVTMQSNDGATLPPTAPGVTNIAYWVTVRTVQTVPQLFSSIANNTQGTVSAAATAGIVATVVPGSFFGMNRKGDCLKTAAGANFDCGLDVDETAKGGGIPSCTVGGVNVGSMSLCAPNGIILASSCNSKTVGCDQAYAGNAAGGAAGSSLTVMSNGAVTGQWQPSSPTWSTNASTFDDPTAPNSQPPLMTPGNTMGTCAIHKGTGITGSVGPFLYYSYTNIVNGVPVPDKSQLTISGTATFSANANCPTGAIQTGSPANQTNSNFPTYVFYGGLNNGGTMNLNAGQYVMAGIDPSNNSVTTVYSGSGTVQSDPSSSSATSTGTMFISTDSSYPGLNLPNNFPVLNQGSISLKNANIDMSGLVNSVNTGSNLPRTMNAYSGIVWWQDRRNSQVAYNQDNGTYGCSDALVCTGDDGSVIYCNDPTSCDPSSTSGKLSAMIAANHVTNTSPLLDMDPGNANIALNGVFYQPRGAWLQLIHGNTGFTCGGGKKASSNCPLQVITGAAIFNTGDDSIVLAGLSNSLLTFKAALIQ